MDDGTKWRAMADAAFAVLDGRVTGPRYGHLTPPLRQAVREILLDTKTDIPADLRATPARQ